MQSIIDLNAAVATFLNIETYSKSKYLKGSAKGSVAADFELANKIFLRDSKTGEVTTIEIKSPDDLPKAVIVTSGLTKCAVTNYVSEVHYWVYYRENTDGLYTIADKGIQIEFMLEK